MEEERNNNFIDPNSKVNPEYVEETYTFELAKKLFLSGTSDHKIKLQRIDQKLLPEELQTIKEPVMPLRWLKIDKEGKIKLTTYCIAGIQEGHQWEFPEEEYPDLYEIAENPITLLLEIENRKNSD